MTTFTLPDLGEGLQDAEIVSWLVGVGDRVVADQPLVSVETGKAVVEVPAPWSGVVTKLHAEPGDTVEIGAPLADFESESDRAGGGTVVGKLPEAEPEKQTPAKKTPRKVTSTSIKAVPAARKLARERGIDLTALSGSGPDGTITRADVEAAAGSGGVPEGWEAIRGVRRTMARRMAEAHREIAATHVTDRADVSHWAGGEDVTLRLVRAIVAGAIAEPALNAWFDGAREARLLHDRVDLGIAVNSGDGLFVPVLRDAGAHDPAELRTMLERLKSGVDDRSIPPADLAGQTITLSNFGMIGGRHAALTIVPPQVAILGAGRITAEPRVVRGRIEPGRVLPISLSFDHRAATGAEATRFLMAAIADLEA